jgi:ABC-type spermidine/putrescine transport system permease subunit I
VIAADRLVATRPLGSGRRRRAGGREGAAWLLAMPLAFVVVCLLIPLAAIFVTALSDKGLAGSADTLGDPVFLAAARRTVLMATSVTALAWVLGLVYALALAVARGPVRWLLWGSLLASFWVSLVVRMFGWILLYLPSGPINRGAELLGRELVLFQTTIGVYPALLHVMLPLMVLPLYAGLLSLDGAQVWAAKSLGARPLTVLRRVVLPQLLPATIAGVTLVFLVSLGFYVTPAFLGSPSDLMIGTIISRDFSQLYDFGAASVLAGSLLIVVLVVYLVVDRLFGVSAQWQRQS